jgi:2-polyprenyl-3-methyl-5-hydroxy-6-metoxy-1,4-benzoquinol methylase
LSCILCGERDFRELFRASDRLYATTEELFPVVECSSCGLVRMEPVPTDLGRFYPKNYWFKPGASWAARLEEQYRRMLIRDHVAFVEASLKVTGGPVLDVGCGGGLFLGVLQERGARVLGLDNSEEAARAAWVQNRVPVLLGDLLHAPFARASCGVVTMFHVLEHLPDPGGFLRAARELLKQGGRLVIQVPNRDCWQYGLLGRRWNGMDVPRHVTDFRTKDMERLLEQSGFRVKRRKFFSWRDNPAGLASSLAPELDPVARNVRALDGSGAAKLLKDLVYLGLVLASVPFAVAEAVAGKGSTVMFEAEAR